MKLIDALATLRDGRRAAGDPLSALLACGFAPLHLRTLLAAHLQTRFPERRVELRAGHYGDLAGTIEAAADTSGHTFEAAAIVVEWSDLDPRLGVRGRGGWSPRALPDIVRTAERAVSRLRAAIDGLAARCVVALCAPTLPLPPISSGPAVQASAVEIELGAAVSTLTAWAVRHPRVRVVRPHAVDARSAAGERLDVASEIRLGFPYQLAHADVVAELLATVIAGPLPKKGLITDLDDTLWRGLLGEDGTAGVTWDLADGAHVHALYQQLLDALADSGVLVAVASKNDPGLVEEALARSDLLVARDSLYPVHAGWGAKSEAVGRILRTWNVAAEGVVFVDDTPMELAEVAAVHPGIECVRFPREDPAAVWATLERLRDLFARSAITDEDRLRLASVRAGLGAGAPAAGSAALDAFLAEARAEITVDFRLDPDDLRARELVNKTNQFTLNGRRYTDGQWRALLARPGAFLLRASYRDRFGPLGKIAVLAGRRAGAVLTVDVWAMSCRAFSRRIEHQCLRQLVARFGAEELVFDYAKTDHNGPVQELFGRLLGGGSPPGAGVTLSRRELETACPALHHTIREALDG